MEKILNFQNNITIIRRIHGLTLEQVAAKVGRTRQQVRKWETGDAFPDIQDLDAISKLFKIDIETLMYANLTIQTKGEETWKKKRRKL